LIQFCNKLEQVCISTVEGGEMTKDLAVLVYGNENIEGKYLTTQEFLAALKRNLEKVIN
jgi:isocitrate dehydrogenase